MAYIVRTRTLFCSKVAVVIARRAAVVENVGISRGLIEVDGMRPRVSCRCLKSTAVPLVDLNRQAVVVAQVRIFNLVHAAVSSVGPRPICRCRVRASYISRLVQNRIGDWWPKRPHIEVSHAV